MNGLVFEKLKSDYFTYMKEIFEAMDGEQKNYNWLISNYECNKYTNAIPFNKPYVWFDGETLTQIVNEHNMQFIDAFFSAFPKHITEERAVENGLPYIFKDPNIHGLAFNVNNPLTEILFIAYDSSMALIATEKEDIIKKLKKEYPEAIELKDYYKNN